MLKKPNEPACLRSSWRSCREGAAFSAHWRWRRKPNASTKRNDRPSWRNSAPSCRPRWRGKRKAQVSECLWFEYRLHTETTAQASAGGLSTDCTETTAQASESGLSTGCTKTAVQVSVFGLSTDCTKTAVQVSVCGLSTDRTETTAQVSEGGLSTGCTEIAAQVSECCLSTDCTDSSTSE